MSVNNRQRNSKREKEVLRIELEQADALFEDRGVLVLHGDIVGIDLPAWSRSVQEDHLRGIETVTAMREEMHRNGVAPVAIPALRHAPHFR